MDKTKRAYRIGMIIFLVLVVLGFVVPGMFYSDPSSTPQVEPRVCQNDGECYLMCNEEPLKVLCSQNLCQQNSCTEITSYPFNESISFQLQIKVNDSNLNLNNRSLPGNMFVTFDSDKVNIFSPHILLSQVLEKFHITMSSDCLVFDGNNYCRDENHNLTLKVNGEQSYSYQAYLPENGDKAEIVYS